MNWKYKVDNPKENSFLSMTRHSCIEREVKVGTAEVTGDEQEGRAWMTLST
jgi:hypothetical protein